MPIYEFKCEKCGTVFEELRSISRSDDDAECPECHARARRIISAFSTSSGNASSSGSCTPSGGT